MLSQENINKILKEKVLSKTAADGDPWYAKAKNWATADNYSNLKNVGIGAGAAALAGGATYAASGLIPGLKKKRLARALMALGVGGAAGGAAGYYGKDIRNFDYGKLNPWRGNTAKPEVKPVTSPQMPKVQPVTPAPKAKALSDSDWKRSRTEAKAQAKAAPVAPAVEPTLANAAALPTSEIERRQKYRKIINNLRSKINDPVQVTTNYGPGPSREEVASSNAARKLALAKKKKKEQELKNKGIADEYAKRIQAQADAPYVPAPTYEEVRRASAKQQQKLTQDALRRGR